MEWMGNLFGPEPWMSRAHPLDFFGIGNTTEMRGFGALLIMMMVILSPQRAGKSHLIPVVQYETVPYVPGRLEPMGNPAVTGSCTVW